MSSTEPQRAALDHALTFAVYVIDSRIAALAILRQAVENTADLERPVELSRLYKLSIVTAATTLLRLDAPAPLTPPPPKPRFDRGPRSRG